MGVGKILEGRREELCLNCLLNTGLGLSHFHPRGPLDEAYKIWFLSSLMHAIFPSPYSPTPILHAH